MLSLKSKKTAKEHKLTNKDYEKLGRVMASVYETGYLDAARSYKQSFIKGIFQGLGGVLGATVLVALLVWILSFFGDIPLIGRFTDKVENTINSRQVGN